MGPGFMKKNLKSKISCEVQFSQDVKKYRLISVPDKLYVIDSSYVDIIQASRTSKAVNIYRNQFSINYFRN